MQLCSGIDTIVVPFDRLHIMPDQHRSCFCGFTDSACDGSTVTYQQAGIYLQAETQVLCTTATLQSALGCTQAPLQPLTSAGWKPSVTMMVHGMYSNPLQLAHHPR